MVLDNLFAQKNRNAIMILHADSPGLDSPPSILTDAFRPAPDRKEGLRNKAWTPPGVSCLRCGGLLAPSYTASLERDITGELVRQWRCVNCGDCLDSIILANRWKNPVPARETSDSRANIVCQQPVMTGVLEVRVPKASEGKKTTSTVKIDRVLVL
jgi:hypothetical protein